MNFVLIFCNSTAGRLIYAYSHYNMCAGGGCMYQISNEKFGLFVTELRKEKNLTQKDLAEKLYVSDKTVSKWERGLSMPNVVLLIPIADHFFLHLIVEQMILCKNHVISDCFQGFCNYWNRLFYSFSQFCYFCF